MRPLLAIALAAGLLLAAAACGGGDGGDAESTGALDTGVAVVTEEAPPETTAEEPTGDEPFQIKVPSSAPIGPTSPPKTIKQLQRALKMLGYDVGTPDGIWGDKTSKAVKKFQKEHKLGADGLVGAKTAREINKELAAQQQGG
jgi:peptidoglycan hydrolase-like protein with peptidoglycan-binding domain